MTYSISERVNSQGGTVGNDSAGNALKYVVERTDPADDPLDASAVVTVLDANVPATFEGYVFDYYDYEPSENPHDVWFATVNYRLIEKKNADPPPVGEARAWFGTDTAEATIYRGTRVAEYVPAGATALGVSFIGDDGKKLNGASVKFPVHTFGYDFTIAGASLTAGYVAAATALVGKKNAATFAARAAGSVLCTGVNGDYTVGSDSTLQFSFAFQENETGVTVGTITGIAKKGWQYLDVLQRLEKNPTTKRTKVSARQVTIWDVHPDGDFTAFAIPGT